MGCDTIIKVIKEGLIENSENLIIIFNNNDQYNIRKDNPTEHTVKIKRDRVEITKENKVKIFPMTNILAIEYKIKDVDYEYKIGE